MLYRYRRHLGSSCYNQFDTMLGNIENVLCQTWQRRGLHGQPNLDIVRQRLSQPMSQADICRSWACHALEQNNRNLARYHAWQAIKREPLAMQSWKVAYWSLAA
ncbi:MAG: hypothetical protein HC898_01615 [Phycisphaerales bacterium]|nr:hypothetical protein [Phycisphaerales bacterium]